MNQTLDDLEKNQNNIETPNKRKKRLKWLLIFLWILLSLGWVWAWLTKAWVIPNWFGIELLCSENQNETLIEEWENVELRMWDYWCHEGPNWVKYCLDKPIIYLYPTS